MGVVDLEKRQGLSALPLMERVEALAARGQLVQARALVVLRQQPIAPFVADAALAADIETLQGELRSQARHGLDRLVPEVLHAITGLQGVRALQQSVVQMAAGLDAAQLGPVADALHEALQAPRAQGLELARLARLQQQAMGDLEARLGRTLGATATALGAAEDGEVARLQQEIDEISTAMSAAVKETVDAGKDMGGGVKRIATWVMSLFTGRGDDPAPPPRASDRTKDVKPAADDADGGTDSSALDRDADKDKDKDKGKGQGQDIDPPKRPSPLTLKKPDEAFPAESIGEVSDGAERVVLARSRLNHLADRLHDRYQALYRAQALLAVVNVARQQARDYLRDVGLLVEGAQELDPAWDDLARHVAAARDAGALPFDASWQRLDARFDHLVRAFAQGGDGVPRLTLPRPPADVAGTVLPVPHPTEETRQ